MHEQRDSSLSLFALALYFAGGLLVGYALPYLIPLLHYVF